MMISTLFMHLLRFAFICLLVSSSSMVSAIDVRIIAHHPSRYNLYATELLNHALSYHGDKYSMSYLNMHTELAREMELLEKGTVSVVWQTTSVAAEERFIPVRVPISGGLLAYRVMLIRPEMQEEFDRVDSFEDLKQFKFGSGEHWADTSLLENNGLKVVTTTVYLRMFDMLHHGRFDAFPRGITEPWTELKANSHLHLAVENNIVFVYKLPVYFFVTKKAPELARDLEIGMNKAIDDGSLKKLLQGDPDVVQGLKKLNLKRRKVFYLSNPDLPPKTPLHVKKYWFSVDDLNDGATLP